MSDPTQEPTQEPTSAPEEQPEDPAARQPDEDAGPAVEPAVGDQGEYVEQDAVPSGSFDPNRPVRTSAPPADAQSGVPSISGENAGVEPQPEFAGPVDSAQADASHAEANATDGDPERTEGEGDAH